MSRPNNESFDVAWVADGMNADIHTPSIADTGLPTGIEQQTQYQHDTDSDFVGSSMWPQSYAGFGSALSTQGPPSSYQSLTHIFDSNYPYPIDVSGPSWDEIDSWPDANSMGEHDEIPASGEVTGFSFQKSHGIAASDAVATTNADEAATAQTPIVAQAVGMPGRRNRAGNWTAADDALLKAEIHTWQAGNHGHFRTRKEEYTAMWASVARVFENRAKGTWSAKSCDERATKIMVAYNVYTEANADRRISWTVEEDRLHRDLRVAGYDDEQTAVVLNFAALGKSNRRNASGVRGRWAKVQQGRHLSPNEYGTYMAAARPISANVTAILRMDIFGL